MKVAFVSGILPIAQQRDGFFSFILPDMLRSIVRQSSADWRVVLTVGWKEADAFRVNDSRIRVVEAFEPSAPLITLPRFRGTTVEAYEAIRIDKGLRLLRAIIEARRLGAEWVAIIDADELVHCDFVQWLAGIEDGPGFVQTEGIAWQRNAGRVWWIPGFNRLCGSCFVIRTSLFDFPNVSDIATENEAIERVGYQYLTRVLGSHLYADKLFDLRPIQKRFTCYHLGTGCNVSDMSAPAAERLPLDHRGGKQVAGLHLAPYWSPEFHGQPLPLALD